MFSSLGNAHAAIWPLAERCVRVTVEQVFGNCGAWIPRMRVPPPADHEQQEE